MKKVVLLLLVALVVVLSGCGKNVNYTQKRSLLFSEMGLEAEARPLRIELPVDTGGVNMKVIRPGYEASASSAQVEVWKDVPTVLFLYRFEGPGSDSGRLLGVAYHSPGDEKVVFSATTTALWLVTLPGYLNPGSLGFEDLAEFQAWARATPRFDDLVRAVEAAVRSGRDIMDDEDVRALVQAIWQELEQGQGPGPLGGAQDAFSLKWDQDDFLVEVHRGTPLGIAAMDASEKGSVSTSFVRAALLFDRSIFGAESRTLTSLLHADQSLVCVRGIDRDFAYRDLVEVVPEAYGFAIERTEAEAIVAARLPFMAELIISGIAFVPAYGDAISIAGEAAYTLVETFGEDLDEMLKSFGKFLAQKGGRLTINRVVHWLDWEFRTRQRAQSLARKLAKLFTGDARRTRMSSPLISIAKKVFELAGKVLMVGDAANLYSLIKDSNGPSGCYLVDKKKRTIREIKGPMVEINPNGIEDGEVNVEYTFDVTVRFLRSAHFPLQLSWAFGDGTNGSDEIQSGGSPYSFELSHAYASPGAYALTVSAETSSGTASSRSVHVFVGERTERDYDLSICDTWKAANSGGEGVYLDSWDISDIPEGAVFDIAFNTYCVPDKILVSDPDGVEVLDTGWRGCSSYEGDPNYPGGIAGPGQGFVGDLFQKREGQTRFEVVVVGGGPGTAWDYQVRCRIPAGQGAAVQGGHDPAVQELFAREREEHR